MKLVNVGRGPDGRAMYLDEATLLWSRTSHEKVL